MNKLFSALSLFSASFCFAQLVTLSKVEASVQNNDKFLYQINPNLQQAQYLGEVEVDGFSSDDTAVYAKVYEKAKSIGANAFSYQPVATISNTEAPTFNVSHYKLNLYYSTTFPKEDNIAYVISSGNKPQKISISGKNIMIQPRSYIKQEISSPIYITTRKILGARINLTPKEGQPVQYFQTSAFRFSSDKSGYQGGINIKSGDIIGLEKSYAQFLTTIYKEQK